MDDQLNVLEKPSPFQGFSLQTAQALSSQGREPAELSNARREAAKRFVGFPWPSREDEAWRRTDLTELRLDRYAVSQDSFAPSNTLPEAFRGFVGEDEAVGVWGPEGFHRRHPAELSDKGVLFLDLAEAVGRVPQRVWPHFGRVVSPDMGKFSALSAAFWTRGLFVYVPKGIDAGIVLHGGHAPRLSDGQASVSRTLIVAEPGSRLTFVEDAAASGPDSNGSALAVAGVELVLAENAQVTYVNFQRHHRRVNHFLVQNAHVERDARLTTLAVALGGDVSRADFGSDLVGEGAAANLYGLVFGDGRQRFTHHTRQHHKAPRTTSDLLFKSALMDQARAVYTGLIHIEKSATKAEAYQASKNVLLSSGARANAIPMLEILTDDVKCGHGAAVGGLDADQRFYMMARGLDRAEAERAMVEGFFEDVLQRGSVPGLHDRLRAVLDAKLAGGRRG